MNENQTYNTIPENIVRKGMLLGKPIRNWIEGAVLGFLFVKLVQFIPFVEHIGNIMKVVVFVIVAFLCIRGFKNRSVTQIIIDEFRFRRRKRRLHLRTPNYVRVVKSDALVNESAIEYALRKAKERINIFIKSRKKPENKR